MQAWKKRYLHNPLSFALEWFFSLPSYLLQQNYFLDFTHFNIEELDLTDQRFFWNRNVVNWRRAIFCYELYVFLSVVRSYVISRFLGGKKVGNDTPHSKGKYVLPRNNIKRLKGTFGFIWRVLKTIWWIVLQLFWSCIHWGQKTFNFPIQRLPH